MKTKSQTRIALQYGVILGVINSIVYLSFHFGGADPESKYPSIVGYIITILAIIYGIKNYRDKESGGFISYGQSLGTGVLIGLFSGIISAIFTVLMFTVIDPALLQKVLDTAQQKLAEKSMSEEQIQISMAWTKKIMTPPFLFIFAIIGSVLQCIIFSLIISIFMKKEQSPFESTTPDSNTPDVV